MKPKPSHVLGFSKAKILAVWRDVPIIQQRHIIDQSRVELVIIDGKCHVLMCAPRMAGALLADLQCAEQGKFGEHKWTVVKDRYEFLDEWVLFQRKLAKSFDEQTRYRKKMQARKQSPQNSLTKAHDPGSITPKEGT